MAGPKWVNQNPELVFCTQDGHNQPRQAGTPCKKCRARLLKAKKRRELYKKSEEHIRVRAEMDAYREELQKRKATGIKSCRYGHPDFTTKSCHKCQAVRNRIRLEKIREKRSKQWDMIPASLA